MNNKNSGFTLMETLIATSIFLLMMAMLYPVFSSSRQAGNLMNKLDVYHDARRIDQKIFDELKFGTQILYPQKSNEWYPQLIFRNHLNQVLMLYVNENDKLVLFNFDNVTGSYLSLGKILDSSKISSFEVKRDGSSVIEYKLTFLTTNDKEFIVTDKVTLMNIF